MNKFYFVFMGLLFPLTLLGCYMWYAEKGKVSTNISVKDMKRIVLFSFFDLIRLSFIAVLIMYV